MNGQPLGHERARYLLYEVNPYYLPLVSRTDSFPIPTIMVQKQTLSCPIQLALTSACKAGKYFLRTFALTVPSALHCSFCTFLTSFRSSISLNIAIFDSPFVTTYIYFYITTIIHCPMSPLSLILCGRLL